MGKTRTPHKVRYYVNEWKGTTTAVMYDCGSDAFEAVFRRLSGILVPVPCSMLWNKGGMPDKFAATVKCHPEDTYDEETGKQEALKKLMNVYNSSLKRHENAIMNAYVDYIKDHMA